MSCPFLKPHHCAGCSDVWRCDGAAYPAVIVENLEPCTKGNDGLFYLQGLPCHVEDLELCFEGDYRGCSRYVAGLEQRALAKQIKLNKQKRDKLIEDGMRHLESILSIEPDCEVRLEKLKELYHARLRDLHEYKAEVRRLKGR